MEEDIINKIIDNLKESVKEKGKFVKLSYPNYDAVEIDSKNFHIIDQAKTENKIVFIDGGNAEILKAANFSLQFIRVYYTIYKNNKRISNKKYEFYLLVKSFDNNGKIFFKTDIFGDKVIDGFEIDSFDKTIIQGNNRADVSFIGNVARRFSEISVVKELIEKLEKEDVVVLDGNLDAKYANEEKVLDEVYNKSAEKGVILTALSKTCELFTDKGNSFVSVLADIQPENEWYYHPIAKSYDEKNEIVFVKLNRKSDYIFRFDIFNKQISMLENVLSLLKLNSKDPVFIGYPYGFVEADRFARVSNKDAEILKTKFMIKAGAEWKNINNFLKAKDSHSVLDRIG